MRAILLVAALLVGLGVLAGEFDVPDRTNQQQPAAGHWVRTRDGWERTSDWSPPDRAYLPALHPLPVAAGQLLLSLLGLAWLGEE